MKTLYIIACCMFVTAIVCQFYAASHFGLAHRNYVQSQKQIARGEPETTMEIQEREANLRTMHISTEIVLAGLLAVGLGIASWISSVVKGKKNGSRLTPVLPWVLLIIYMMLYVVI